MVARLRQASRDGTVRLWDLATHRQLGSLPNSDTGPVRASRSALMGACSRRVSGDGTVRLWDVATHNPARFAA